MPHDDLAGLNREQQRLAALAEYLVRRSVREALQPLREQLQRIDTRTLTVQARLEHILDEASQGR